MSTPGRSCQSPRPLGERDPRPRAQEAAGAAPPPPTRAQGAPPRPARVTARLVREEEHPPAEQRLAIPPPGVVWGPQYCLLPLLPSGKTPASRLSPRFRRPPTFGSGRAPSIPGGGQARTPASPSGPRDSLCPGTWQRRAETLSGRPGAETPELYAAPHPGSTPGRAFPGTAFPASLPGVAAHGRERPRVPPPRSGRCAWSRPAAGRPRRRAAEKRGPPPAPSEPSSCGFGSGTRAHEKGRCLGGRGREPGSQPPPRREDGPRVQTAGHPARRGAGRAPGCGVLRCAGYRSELCTKRSESITWRDLLFSPPLFLVVFCPDFRNG